VEVSTNGTSVFKGNVVTAPPSGAAAESPTTVTFSNWAQPPGNCVNGIRMGLIPATGNGTLFHFMDFRFGFQSADSTHTNTSDILWSAWVSDIGGTCPKGQACLAGFNSGIEIFDYLMVNNTPVSPVSYRIALEVRAWPKPNRDLQDVQLGVRAWDQNPTCTSIFPIPNRCSAAGDWQLTPWLRSGGGFTHTAVAPLDPYTGFCVNLQLAMEPAINVAYVDR
jgi:hypothetical protein